MVFFNYALRKLNAKIVYYGPGLCGKTTNLQWIHDHFEGGQRGKMISLATEGDRTIFFDLLPIDIGSIRGMDVTLQLYTVPGQVHYNSTRQLVLRGADGVVFVADSQRTMKSSNVESYENLQENLMLQGLDLKTFPHALQFNKRDLRDLLSPEDLDESLNVFSVPIFEAIATEGIGVQETLEGIVKLVMRNLREKYEPVASASGPRAPVPMQATGPTAFGAPTTPAAAPPSPAVAPPPPVVPPPPAAQEPTPEVETPDPAFVPPSISMPAPEATEDAGLDAGVASFQNEDGISTAVYEDENAETASHEPIFEGPDFGDKSPVFAPEGDASASAFEPERPEEPGGIFAESLGGEGDGGDVAASLPTEDPVETPEPEFLGGATEEPEVFAEIVQPEIPEESMEDLFETEVPSVKTFVEQSLGGKNATVKSARAADEGDAPASVDLDATAVAPPRIDRYEDRIEAPGPFAPAPGPTATAKKPEPPKAESADDEEAVRAEVRQALGASEDREALASLSPSEDAEPDASDLGLEDPPEVQPVVPPTPEEPSPADTVMVSREPDPPPAEAEEPEPAEAVDQGPAAAEPVWEPEPIEVQFEPAETEETTIVEPEVEEVFVEEPVVEEPVVEKPRSPEPFVDEAPAVDPIAADPVAPPPRSVVDPLEKSQPIVVGLGDPFADEEDEAVAVVAEVIPDGAPAKPPSDAISVSAQDNQLHLALKGSGAIAEMGQVRALDLEVPVPGEWVGNRKVTLQLRLTLTPAEDEDG